MPKKLPTDLLQRLIVELATRPDGAAIDQLAKTFAPLTSRRSLQRKLAQWVANGDLRAAGERRGRRYLAPLPPQDRNEDRRPISQLDWPTPIARPARRPADADFQGSSALQLQVASADSIPISIEGAEVRGLVRRSLVDRNPVGYRREFLDRYQPGVTYYLPEVLRRNLHEFGRTPGSHRPAGTYARQILERLLVDLSWNSSRLEGNTYSLLETEQLIHDRRVAPGKDPKETQMILNHKAAIELLIDSPQELGVNRYTVQNLHALLADNLLDDPAHAGRLRETPVGVAGSVYVPTAIPQLVDELFGMILEKAKAIPDSFEQSFFLLVHLPYLQPFADVNKRTSRLAANIPLIRNNVVPLSFTDVPEQLYIDGLIGVYEFNRVELLRDVFAWAYERSCRRYKTVRQSLPEPDPFRLKYRAELAEAVAQAVRGNALPTVEQIKPLAMELVDQQDLDRFTTLVISELANLHEGNIARFKLRPGEFHAWRRRLT